MEIKNRQRISQNKPIKPMIINMLTPSNGQHIEIAKTISVDRQHPGHNASQIP